MYTHRVHHFIADRLANHHGLKLAGNGLDLYNRFMVNATAITELYNGLYSHHPNKEKF